MRYFKMTDVFHPYVITFEDTEYLKLQFESLTANIIKVTGTDESISQWVERTHCIEITNDEYETIVAELAIPMIETTEQVE